MRIGKKTYRYRPGFECISISITSENKPDDGISSSKRKPKRKPMRRIVRKDGI
jgi:hypothetical protein